MLSQALMVSLARAIYSESEANPKELLDAIRFPDTASITDHLLDEFCVVAYDRLPQDKHAQGQFQCTANQAQAWLGCLATALHAHNTYDLPAYLMSGFWPRFKDTVQYAFLGRSRLRVATELRTPFWKVSYYDEPSKHFWRERITPMLAVGALVFLFAGAFTGFMASLLDYPPTTPDKLSFSLLVGLIMGIPIGIGSFWFQTESSEDEEGSWLLVSRKPRGRATLAGSAAILLYPFAQLLAYWLVLGQFLIAAVWPYFVIAPLFIIDVFLESSVISTRWNWRFSRPVLIFTRKLPWRTIAFLEDAHQRGVLRKVGDIYQFRHATIQNRLARQWLVSQRPRVLRRRVMLDARYNLAVARCSVKEYEEFKRLRQEEAEFRAVLAERRRKLGDSHWKTLYTWFIVAHMSDDKDELRQLLQQARRSLGGGHSLTIATWTELTKLLMYAYPNEAEAIATELLEKLRAIPKDRHSPYAFSIDKIERELADVMRRLGQPTE